MGRSSKVLQLPRELVDKINGLIRDGRTIDQILSHLGTIEGDDVVSRASLGRYVKASRESMAKYAQAAELASLVVKDMGERPGSEVGVLVGQLLKTMAWQTATNWSENFEDKKPDPSDLRMLARMIRDVEATQASVLLRQQLEEKIMAKAAASVRTVGSKAGVSEDTLKLIERELGLL